MSVIFKKRLITVIALLVIVAVTVAASVVAWKYISAPKGGSADIQKMTTRQIVDKIVGQMNYRDITQVDDSQLLRHYNIDKDIIDDFTMYVSANIESAFEIACFKLTAEDNVSLMNAAISQHMNDKAAGYMDLNPDQYNMINSYQTAAVENYVFVVVSTDADAAKQAFLDLCGVSSAVLRNST